jgi:hypothetical protein
MRYIEDDDTLEFAEKILTFNYRPGKDTWAAYTKKGTWISQQGKDSRQSTIKYDQYANRE